MTTRPSNQLETFANPERGATTIAFECPDSPVLPADGPAGLRTIPIDYVPDQQASSPRAQLYPWSYRDEGAFHEAVTNRICDDLVAAMAPRSITVTGKFLVRGGISTTVTVSHSA